MTHEYTHSGIIKKIIRHRLEWETLSWGKTNGHTHKHTLQIILNSLISLES